MNIPELIEWELKRTNLTEYRIRGKIYNDKRFEDGTLITTSILKSIDFENGICITKNTMYQLR